MKDRWLVRPLEVLRLGTGALSIRHYGDFPAILSEAWKNDVFIPYHSLPFIENCLGA